MRNEIFEYRVKHSKSSQWVVLDEDANIVFVSFSRKIAFGVSRRLQKEARAEEVERQSAADARVKELAAMTIIKKRSKK